MNLFALIATLAQIFAWIIMARVVISWFPNINPRARDFLNRLTDPILAPIRRLVYRGGPFDLSPMIAFFILQMIAIVLTRAA